MRIIKPALFYGRFIVSAFKLTVFDVPAKLEL
jgi:hypothetical protein